MNLQDIVTHLKSTKQELKIMEVCGTHTSAIAKNGIRSLISSSVKLVSGPGCPVCVTHPSIIDGLISCAFDKDCTVLSFGDMFRVKGSEESLAGAKAKGASVQLMYSPFDVLPLALNNPNRLYVIAAVGFETTAPVYAALAETLIKQRIDNVKLYSALKTMPEILEYVCENESVDAFICPGHVSVVIGEDAYLKLWEKFKKPFVIAGFEAEHVLSSIYEILCQAESGTARVKNMYKSVVTKNGQEKAQELICRYFEKTDSIWRGIGKIKNSGYILRPEYANLSANKGFEQEKEEKVPEGCRCTDVILGRIAPQDCPLFQNTCTPENPVGACMVSMEGSCKIAFRYR